MLIKRGIIDLFKDRVYAPDGSLIEDSWSLKRSVRALVALHLLLSQSLPPLLVLLAMLFPVAADPRTVAPLVDGWVKLANVWIWPQVVILFGLESAMRLWPNGMPFAQAHQSGPLSHRNSVFDSTRSARPRMQQPVDDRGVI